MVLLKLLPFVVIAADVEYLKAGSWEDQSGNLPDFMKDSNAKGRPGDGPGGIEFDESCRRVVLAITTPSGMARS